MAPSVAETLPAKEALVRVGVVFPHHQLSGDPPAIRAHAQAAEAAGYDHYLAYEHVVGAQRDRPGGFTGPYDHESRFTEPFVLFAHLAAVTTFLEFATGILILPQRQTPLVARQAADVQTLSRGRLRLGIGVGWNEVEYGAMGADFGTRGQRIEEQVELLRLLWSEPVVDFEGRWDRVHLAAVTPRPPRRIPIWMGGSDGRVLDRIGRLADGWMPPLGPPDEIATKLARIRAAAADAGRDPATIGVNPTLPLTGDTARDVETALRWRAVGATHLSLSTLRREFPTPADHIEAIEVFKQAWDDAQ